MPYIAKGIADALRMEAERLLAKAVELDPSTDSTTATL
jgi:hypothetical protein